MIDKFLWERNPLRGGKKSSYPKRDMQEIIRYKASCVYLEYKIRKYFIEGKNKRN